MKETLLTTLREFCHRTRRNALFLTLSITILPYSSQAGQSEGDHEQKGCRIVKITPERIADMNIPRAGHCILMLNGEPTVIGGHTHGFVPTPTAEYFSNGEWHEIPTVYTHDDAMAVSLCSGKVLVAGGHSDNLGIGQTFEAEMYDPASHSFVGFGCMDRKRAMSQGVETDSGHVVITGNHYEDDGIELFDGSKFFNAVKPVSEGRSRPYVLRISGGDVAIFGNMDIKFKHITNPMVDRLKGGSFHVPLFEKWSPLCLDWPFSGEMSFCGDEQTGDYSYLIPVFDNNGQMAVALMRDTVFSLLPTSALIPKQFKGHTINYESPFIVDRRAKCAYMAGSDRDLRHYIVCIEYGTCVQDPAASTPAQLTLYYTDPIPEMGNSIPLLTPDGHLMLIGGNDWNHDNFDPLASTWLFVLDNKSLTTNNISPFAYILPVGMLVMAGCLFILWRRRKQKLSRLDTPDDEVMDNEDEDEAPTGETDDNTYDVLIQRICQLMEEQKLYLNCDLKIPDVAAELSTNRRSISECINAMKGCSFSQFVNTYRVQHAKQLLREQPNKKISSVAIESGFTNQTSFFRTFKAMTGMTPKEWSDRKKFCQN